MRCLRHRRRRKRARCLAQAKGGAARTLLRVHSVASCHVQVDAEVARLARSSAAAQSSAHRLSYLSHLSPFIYYENPLEPRAPPSRPRGRRPRPAPAGTTAPEQRARVRGSNWNCGLVQIRNLCSSPSDSFVSNLLRKRRQIVVYRTDDNGVTIYLSVLTPSSRPRLGLL